MSDTETCPGCGGGIVTQTELGETYRGCENCGYNVDKSGSTPVLEQLEAVRRSGLTNMVDLVRVKRIAYECEFYALVTFIEDESFEDILDVCEEAYEKYAGKELSVEVPESVEFSVTLD